MGAHTPIEWTDATWNPIRARERETGKVGWHCAHKNEACINCYAEAMNLRLGTGWAFKAQALEKVEIFLDQKMKAAPYSWKRPRKIFVCSMTDLFADFVADEMIDRMFAVMALTPHHTYQILTKRPTRMREYLNGPGRQGAIGECIGVDHRRCRDPDFRLGQWPLPNVWAGVSVHDQPSADDFVPILLDTPAAKRFVSYEPALGPVNLDGWLPGETDCQGCDDGEGSGLHRCSRLDIPRDEQCPENRAVFDYIEHGPFGPGGEPAGIEPRRRVLDWVICGGESGRDARPMHPDWARSIRDQCATAAVPFLFKQWGEFVPGEVFSIEHRGGHAKHQDGLSHSGKPSHWWSGDAFDGVISTRVGKKASGRLLDGRTHDEFPAVAA